VECTEPTPRITLEEFNRQYLCVPVAQVDRASTS
jgi:hypothetical protein